MGGYQNKISFLLRWIFICLLLVHHGLQAQQISIDRGIRVDGLWCFPVVTDSLQYLYLPDRAMLAVDEQKKPQFSFIRYVNDNEDTKASDFNTISHAGGGGILHFLVTYDTDEKKILKANQQLKEILQNEAVSLRGPVIFKEGRFALVSSILNPAEGRTERVIMSMGAAPVLQGSKLALSFEMDPPHSKLLLESFKMPTPDVSLVFDLVFSGLTDAYNAKLTVDWAEVSKYEEIGGGVNVYFVSADLEKTYAEMRKTNAIKLETMGEDARMDNLVSTAYSRLTDMLFQRVAPEEVPAKEQGGLGGLLGSLFSNSSNGPFSSGKTFGFGAHFGYKRKDIKTSGYSVLNFNSRTPSDRHHYITFNVGDFYKKFGQSEDYFKTVSLSDPDFEQRDIFVGLDGDLLPEFDKMINNVTITLRKTHQNGTVTTREMNIAKAAVAEGKNLSMHYGSVGDTNRVAWLNYEYRTQFNFKGGKTYVVNWQQQNVAMINLFVPYERRVIKLEADPDVLKSKNVRSVGITIEYDFFGDKTIKDMTVKPDEDLSQKQFEITLPTGQYIYKYTIRWRLKDGTEKIKTGTNNSGILFIDEFPDK